MRGEIMSQYECFEEEAIVEELDKIQETIDFDTLEQKAAVFKILGDLNRLKIVELLAHYNKLCVYEISRFIDASVATTSHHLITLRNNGIISSEKYGKRVVYALDDQEVLHFLDAASVVTKLVNQKELIG